MSEDIERIRDSMDNQIDLDCLEAKPMASAIRLQTLPQLKSYNKIKWNDEVIGNFVLFYFCFLVFLYTIGDCFCTPKWPSKMQCYGFFERVFGSELSHVL